MPEHESTTTNESLERQQAALGYIVQAMMKEGLTLADVASAYASAVEEKPDAAVQDTPHETIDKPLDHAFPDDDPREVEPEYSEREKKIKHWNEVITQTEERFLAGKIDERMLKIREPIYTAPDQFMPYGAIHMEKGDDHAAYSHNSTPGGSALHRVLERIHNSAGGNTLLFYSNKATDTDLMHFAYRSAMSPGSPDTRGPDGNPLIMYGSIPVSSFDDFWQDVIQDPDLIEELWQIEYGQLVREGWLERRQAETLAIAYVPDVGKGVEKIPPSLVGKTGQQILANGGIFPFSRPVGEVFVPPKSRP
jgi:hypothetical protein